MSQQNSDASVELEARTHAVRALETEMAGLFSRVRIIMREAAEAIAPGLHPSEYKMFTLIARHGPIAAATLAETVSADKGQLSRTVRHLDELGLIQRTPDPNDRRSTLLSATPEGVERLEHTRAAGGSRLDQALAQWDLADIERFAVYLHALAERTPPGKAEGMIPKTHADAH